MTWIRAVFDDAMTHVAHRSLSTQLLDELVNKRACTLRDFSKYDREMGDNPAAITAWGFDIGGVFYQGMPEEIIELDGLAIDVPCDMIATVTAAIRRLRMRRFDDGTPYYKLKIWIHATVLTPAQWLAALAELERRHDAAHDKSEAFFAARKQRMDEREAAFLNNRGNP